jgi:hypothetical protein
MAQNFVAALEKSRNFDRIRNMPLSGRATVPISPKRLPSEVEDVIELVTTVEPPRTTNPFQFNFDYSDIGPIESDTGPIR